MRSKAAHIIVVVLIALSLQAAQSTPRAPESLAGLTPGISRLDDAHHIFGRQSIVLPGEFALYAGASQVTRAYCWSPGIAVGYTGLIVETPLHSSTAVLVMADSYPGLMTSRGLMATHSEADVWRLYGLPMYVFAWHLPGGEARELFYVQEGLLVTLSQVPGRPNWTVTRLIVTVPTYLLNAVSQRLRTAVSGHQVEDMTKRYRVWAHMAQPTDAAQPREE